MRGRNDQDRGICLLMSDRTTKVREEKVGIKPIKPGRRFIQASLRRSTYATISQSSELLKIPVHGIPTLRCQRGSIAASALFHSSFSIQNRVHHSRHRLTRVRPR